MDGLLEFCSINLKKDLEMALFQEITTFLLITEGPTSIDPIKLKLEISLRLKKVTKFDLFDFNYFCIHII
jgi:hypothetical protein